MIIKHFKDSSIWEHRARRLLCAVFACQLCMEKSGEIKGNITDVINFLSLEKLVELARRDDLPHECTEAVKRYLLAIPAMNERNLKTSTSCVARHHIAAITFHSDLE